VPTALFASVFSTMVVVFDSLARLPSQANNNNEDEIEDDEDDDSTNTYEIEHDEDDNNNNKKNSNEPDDEVVVDDSVADDEEVDVESIVNEAQVEEDASEFAIQENMEEEEDNANDENVENDDDSKINDSNDDNDKDNDNESYTPDGDSDDDEGQKVATASAHRLIPTTAKQRTSSVSNLYTNGLDAPKYNKLHKAQQPVAVDAPGFREALENIVIPQEMMFLYQTCLAQPKESFFISAIAHIQVIAKACGLSTQEMIMMRGWVFLNKISLNGAPYRYQSFADSLYDTVTLGANDDVNYRNLMYRFEEVLKKMRTGYLDLTGNFPAPLVVPSRK
jgi:hypothetical protein